MDLDTILTLPAWTPLERVVDPVHDDKMIRRGTTALLYRLSETTYLAISPAHVSGHDLQMDSHGHCVVGILWAPSEGAARRARFMEIEADEGIVLDLPSWWLPEGIAPQYGDILRALTISTRGIAPESANYRIASDGKFICREIATRAYIYYFRGRRHDDSEPPFVVVRNLLNRE